MNNGTGGGTPGGRGPHFLFLLGLSAAILAVYWQTSGFEFLGYDDPAYITENPHVLSGITRESVSWAFSAFHAGNWHPLTWLSHMADVSLFGRDAGWHHRVNVILHCCNTVLLYVALNGMTGAALPSGIAASLFGLHPLHVESVAWVAERKDVLSGLFFVLTLLLYERYVRRGGWIRYLGAVAFFALGLMAKPMLVTLPFVLLLLDVWPLGRTGLASPSDGSERRQPLWKSLALEKVPFLALSMASCGITIVAQRSGGSVAGLENLSLPARAGNALVSYGRYVLQTVWPQSLAVFYPHPGSSLPAWKIAFAFLFVAGISIWVISRSKKFPWLPAGWFWFLGMLVPVIGLVQVGAQAMADRYTYLPSIGLFIIAAWGSSVLTPRYLPRRTLIVLWFLILCVLAAVSWRQSAFWQGTETVFRRAIGVTGENWVAHLNLGWALEQQGRLDEAEFHYRESLRIHPANPYAHNNIGTVRFRRGMFGEAVRHYREAIRLKPDYPQAQANLEKVLRMAFGGPPPGGVAAGSGDPPTSPGSLPSPP